MTGSKMTACRLLLTTALLAASGSSLAASGDEFKPPTTSPSPASRTFEPSKVTNRLIFVPSEQPAAGEYPDPTLQQRVRTVRPTQKLEALKQKKQQTLDELHNKAARLVQAWKAKKAAAEQAAAKQAAADRERALQQKTAADRPAAELQHVQKSPQNPLHPGHPLEPAPLGSGRNAAPTLNPVIEDPLSNHPPTNAHVAAQPPLAVITEPQTTAEVSLDPGQTSPLDSEADPNDPTGSSPGSETIPATENAATENVATEPNNPRGGERMDAQTPSSSAAGQSLQANTEPTLIDGPIDRMALATSLFATEQFAGCLKALESVDPDTLTGESRDWHQYMTACCLRKQGHLSDAESAYRKLLSRSETDWLSAAARWWLDHLNERHKLEDDLAQVNSTLDSWEKEIDALKIAN